MTPSSSVEEGKAGDVAQRVTPTPSARTPDESEKPEAGRSLQLRKRLESLSTVIGVLTGVGSIVAVLAATVSFFVAKPDLMLTVWIQKTTVLYPSETTGDAELPLELNGVAVHSATIFDLHVSNTGRQLIGRQDEPWRLKIAAPEGTDVRLVGQPTTSPHRNLVVRAEQSRRHEIELHLRAFESKVAAELKLLVMNAKPVRWPKLDVAPSLAGLPLEVTPLAPKDRKSGQLFLPLFVFIFISLFVAILLERRAADHANRKKVSWRAYVALLIFGSLFFTALAATGLGRLLAWFD